jgi:hypothetical protein
MASTLDLGIYAEYDFASDTKSNSVASTNSSHVAAVGVRRVLRAVGVSYEAALAVAGTVSIVWTANGVSKSYTMTMAAADPSPTYWFDFPEGFIVGDENTALGITLSASGAGGNIGYLNVFFR